MRKDDDGDPILVAGSATLVRALLRHDLVDELRLQLFPVSIGGGLRCFPDDRSLAAFSLTSTETFDHVVALTYQRRPEGRTPPSWMDLR